MRLHVWAACLAVLSVRPAAAQIMRAPVMTAALGAGSGIMGRTPTLPAPAPGADVVGLQSPAPLLPACAPGLAAAGEHARPAPVSKDPDTNLYGVSAAQLQAMVSILKKHYGSRMLDLAAIGSRARGKASVLKNFRPPTAFSDLDLAPLLKSGASLPDSRIIAEEIRKATGIRVELHGVQSSGEALFDGAVPFYGGGGEAYESFSTGEAVRIALD